MVAEAAARNKVASYQCLRFFSTETFATALVEAFNSHGTVVILWPWSMSVFSPGLFGTAAPSAFIVSSTLMWEENQLMWSQALPKPRPPTLP